MHMMRRNREGGFTLLEVMVALIVTTIGLLGIAKMQALAYASTGSANIRSLVAIQAAGLAASMHANRTYWGSAGAPTTITISGTTISDDTLNTTATAADYCKFGGAGAPCTSARLAAFDLHVWANALSNPTDGLLRNSNAVTTINCPVTIPVNCTISVTWAENAVSLDAQSAAATSANTFKPTYVLYVEP